MRSPAFAVVAGALSLTALGACGNDEKTMHMTLISSATKVVQSDSGRRGPSPADVRALSQPLETQSGRPAGRLDGTVIISDQVRQGSELREFRVGTIQLTLERGNLVAAGVYVSTPRAIVPARGGTKRPIIGGTGVYRGARGELTQTALPGGRIKNVIDIEVPKD
jgi:hypothetical protein